MAGKLTKQKIAYMNQFNKQNYDRIAFLLPKGNREVLKEAAKERGLSLNGLITEAVQQWCRENGVDISEE